MNPSWFPLVYAILGSSCRLANCWSAPIRQLAAFQGLRDVELTPAPGGSHIAARFGRIFDSTLQWRV